VPVLLVDDDPDTPQILSVMLVESSANVETACSVSQALEVIEWFSPNVIVSDLSRLSSA
jgi:CheY-like chemotaxis protein